MRSGWSSARLRALLIITSVSECDRWNRPRPSGRQPPPPPELPAAVQPTRVAAEGVSAAVGGKLEASQLLRWRLASTPAAGCQWWSVSPRFCEFRRPISCPDGARLTRHGALGDRNSPRTAAEAFSGSSSSDAFWEFGSAAADAGVFSTSSSTGENNSPERCLSRVGFPGTTCGDFVVSPRNSASSAFSRLHGLLLWISNALYRHRRTNLLAISQDISAMAAWRSG